MDTLSRRYLLGLFGVSAAALVGEGAGRAEYDYVIVGSGSAGCTLAARLLADSELTVLLIEAGGSNARLDIRDFENPPKLRGAGSTLIWPYESEPQSELLNRTMSYACGKVEGGTSSINGMVWVRGHAADYDSWSNQGCAGWDYAGVQSSFDALQGPVVPSDELPRRIALAHEVVGAAVELGYPYNPDYNGVRQEGVGYTQFNIVGGVRQDAFTTFVAPYLADPRLTVLTGAHVTRLVFDRGSGLEKVVVNTDGREFVFRAAQEVIVCAGAINTAKLLHLSGIGPAAALEGHGIPVTTDLPGVGTNLQDHLISMLARPLRHPAPAGKHVTMLASIFSGVASSGGSQFQFQLYCNSESYPPYPADSMSIGAMNLHPTSRGFVALRSADPCMQPVIQPNFLQTAEDVEASVDAYEMAWEISRAKRLQPWLRRGGGIPAAKFRSRSEVLAVLRAHSRSNFHPVGTCRMGIDEYAVVDPQLRVRGVTGLRLAGAAVMPTITSGNTNAPSMMIGDRCGRIILGHRS